MVSGTVDGESVPWMDSILRDPYLCDGRGILSVSVWDFEKHPLSDAVLVPGADCVGGSEEQPDLQPGAFVSACSPNGSSGAGMSFLSGILDEPYDQRGSRPGLKRRDVPDLLCNCQRGNRRRRCEASGSDWILGGRRRGFHRGLSDRSVGGGLQQHWTSAEKDQPEAGDAVCPVRAGRDGIDDDVGSIEVDP